MKVILTISVDFNMMLLGCRLRIVRPRGNLYSASGADPGLFFRRGCSLLLLYFNTNKPHSFLFLRNTSCIRISQVISGEGGGGSHPLHPPNRSAPVLFLVLQLFTDLNLSFLKDKISAPHVFSSCSSFEHIMRQV